MNVDEFLNPETMAVLAERAIAASTNLVLAILILIIGFIVAGMVKGGVRKAVSRSSRMDDTLSGFFSSIAYYAVVAVVGIAVLARFGVQTASLVAALGAITLAIGFALQGTLSNIAAGVMIIAFRPYSIGDWVEVAGVAGGVKDVNLFTTVLATGDNKKIIVPNGQAWGAIITNYSHHETRRCDFTFGIDYSDNADAAMKIILDLARADTRVFEDPEPWVRVTNLGDSSVDLGVRLWCNAADYWNLKFDMTKAVKEAFDKGGISIPYPHSVEIQKEG